MAELSGRYTGVLVPGGDNYTIAHTAEVGLDAMDLAAIDDLHARIRDQVPWFEVPVLSGRHFGRALGPAGDAQLYVISDEPLTDEQNAVLDRFAQTGEWPWFKREHADS
ncbi:hypothetical protein B4N89_27695 [Embleya scabrispora]|uniref:Uncharacterized protein n=1 Tax=Embleya scabrispora TaxID=159449 RepID=A0A1T3P538_9ACTN|nr:hypothetical protein [Embleya scabrispora]OPC84208.1 hypothetical protein B4N89_27695 [Embleya scabrispora]